MTTFALNRAKEKPFHLLLGDLVKHSLVFQEKPSIKLSKNHKKVTVKLTGYLPDDHPKFQERQIRLINELKRLKIKVESVHSDVGRWIFDWEARPFVQFTLVLPDEMDMAKFDALYDKVFHRYRCAIVGATGSWANKIQVAMINLEGAAEDFVEGYMTEAEYCKVYRQVMSIQDQADELAFHRAQEP